MTTLTRLGCRDRHTRETAKKMKRKKFYCDWMKKRSRVTWRRMRLRLFILAWATKNARSMNWSAPTSAATLITFSWLGSIQCLTICAAIRVSTRSSKKLSAENNEDRRPCAERSKQPSKVHARLRCVGNSSGDETDRSDVVEG